MAALLGTGVMSDAFFMAFRIPNFLRRIFGEGAFSQAFVPVFSELTERNTAEAKQFVSAMSGAMALITFVITLLGMAFAPLFVRLLAPGYIDDPEKFAFTVDALRVMFPYFFCISLVAMSAGILNTVNRFAVPAVTPVLLNVCMIIAMWVLVPLLDQASQALAIGVLVAGFVQLVFQIPSLSKEGYLLRPKIDLNNPAMRRVFSLMLPAIFSVSVAQINMIVNSILASFLVTGAVSWLYFADRLPSLSKEHTSGSAQHFSSMMDWALRWVVIIAVPASFALYLLAIPLLSTILQRGEFTAYSVEMSALALEGFAIGVCGFIFVKVLAPGFFARQDTKTPMKIGVIAVLVNIILSLILVRSLAHTGLALAISIAAWVNASLLFVVLLKKQIYKPESGWLWFLLRVLVAVSVMSACLIYLNDAPEVWYQRSLWQRVTNLTILVFSGVGAYLLSLLVLGFRPGQLLLRPAVLADEAAKE